MLSHAELEPSTYRANRTRIQREGDGHFVRDLADATLKYFSPPKIKAKPVHCKAGSKPRPRRKRQGWLRDCSSASRSATGKPSPLPSADARG